MKKYLPTYIHSLLLFLTLFACCEVKAQDYGYDYYDENNLWKQFDDSFGNSGSIDGWKQILEYKNDYVQSVEHTQGTPDWIIAINNPAGEDWENAIRIRPWNTFPIYSSKAYSFNIVFHADNDVDEVLVRLERRWWDGTHDGGTVFGENPFRFQLEKDKDYILSYKGMGPKENITEDLQLSLLFPDASEGTNITVSRIYIAEVPIEYSFEHYVGDAYSGAVTGTRPNYLNYPSGNPYKTHDDDSRILENADPIQRTHEYIVDKWIFPGQNYELLPYSDFKDGDAHYEENYVRWYDYTTGKKSEKLTFTTQTTELDEGVFGGSGISGGRSATSAFYQSDALSTAETMGIIAMDASIHFNSTNIIADGEKFTIKEPNLTFRNVFVIKNAQLRADEMSNKDSNYAENHKERLQAPEGTPFQYRLPMGEHNEFNDKSVPTDYWYKKDDGTYGQVYHYLVETWKDGQLLGTSRVGAEGDNDIVKTAGEAKGINRTIYLQNPTEGIYTVKIYALDITDDGQPETVYYYGEAKTDENRMLLMEYDLEIMSKANGNMINEEELNNYPYQKPSEMEKIFGKPTTVVDFDEISEEQTTEWNGGRYYKWPRKWEESSYGFGFENRGDYNMYLVTNYTDASPWHQACEDSGIKYDRLYYETNGEQQGYMYYANAAGDPGKMAVLNIGNKFCANTTVYVSAWVMECSNDPTYSPETANVVFSFKGVDSNGTETTLGSFVTGYITGATNTYSNGDNPDNRGRWMHVYYSFKPLITDASVFDHYIISVDNNAINSAGADYVIDDIRAFVIRPSILARQLEPICNGDESTKLLLTSPYDDIMEAFAIAIPSASDKTLVSRLDYCFLDEAVYDSLMVGYDDLRTTEEKHQMYINAFNKALITGAYGDKDDYGILEFCRFYTDNDEYKPGVGDNNKATRIFEAGKNMLVFPVEASDENMHPGKSYIIAMREHNDGEIVNAQAFNLVDMCSVYSDFTVITSGIIKVDGEMVSDQHDTEVCSNQTPVITIDMTGIGNLGVIQVTKESYFDWYFGSYVNYNQAEYNGASLAQAMSAFRALYPSITYEQFEAEARTTDSFTPADKACIKNFVEEGLLVLYKNSEVISTYDKFNKPADDSKKVFITAIPINPTPDREDIRYCLSPLEICINVSTRKPTMLNGDDKMGFYPTRIQVVPLRIGLTQLNGVRIDNLDATPSNVLYMPLRDVKCTSEGIHTLTKSEDNLIYLIASDDPQIPAGTSGAKDIVGTDVKVIGAVNNIYADEANANLERNYGELAFIKDFKFREGYEYTLKFRFEELHESLSGIKSNVCPGDVVCIIKVVPEYQMWTGAVNSNWNNDGNWRRVTSAELLGTAAATADFVTDGGTNDNTHSFVPADFTKVIIPADAQNVPKLYYAREEGNIEELNLPQSEMVSDFIKNMNASTLIGGATTDINYDMSSVDRKDNSIACRSWYDHTCQYIHFNSEAQMLSQQDLFYEKAWADFELEPNKWSTVGSPLINVVSGDLYLPTATARQDTPLFEDITFDASKHDRFHPAVFQRRWNAENAKILHLDKSVTSAMVSLDWSEVYNDVNVNYTSGVGFSIKPDVSMMPADKQPTKVKFRLPKGDKDYWYWNPDHQDGDVNNETVRQENDSLVNGERTHRLADLNNVYAQQVVQNDPTTNYFLIGNPLMCYLDMKRFFDANPSLERKYWIVTGKGQQYAQFDKNTEGYVGNVNDQYLAPFQSFFVKLATTSSATFEPKFNNEMMVAKLADGYESVTEQITSNPAKGGFLTICATDEDGNESTMMLADGSEMQINGIEALFDSNLRQSGYPMVYGTVLGEAMSLTNIMPGDTIPVAVSGVRGMTTLKLKGAADFTTDLYIIDSTTGESRLLDNEVELTQDTNGVRYYIAAEPTGIKSDFVATLPQLKVDGTTLRVISPEGETIDSVHIYQVGGALVAAENNITGEYSINLKKDIYLVAIKFNGKNLNYKIVI